MIGFPEVSYTTNPTITPTTRTISTISLSNGEDYSIVSAGESKLQKEIKEIWDRLNKSVSLVHNCANCGATLHIEENKPVFHCKYCGSTYIVGATQIYSNY